MNVLFATAIAGLLVTLQVPQGMPATTDQNLLHPALRVDQSNLDALWQRGFDDADHRRMDMPFLKPFPREIGKIQTSLFKSETVSWLYIQTPEGAAYAYGFQSRKNFWPEDQVKKTKDALFGAVPSGRKHLVFTGTIVIAPSFTAKGYVRKAASADELKDVHVVIKIGDRIYQPELQPGDLVYREADVSREHSETETSQSQTNSNSTVSNSLGTPVATIKGTASTTNYYTVHSVQNFPVYTGKFLVTFDLFEPDGAARIKPSDQEIEAIVVYGNNERHAKYDLTELDRQLHK